MEAGRLMAGEACSDGLALSPPRLHAARAAARWLCRPGEEVVVPMDEKAEAEASQFRASSSGGVALCRWRV